MKIPTQTILLIAVCVLAGFLLANLFRTNQQKTYLKEFIAAKDSAIAKAERSEQIALKEAAQYREVAQQFINRDTVYITRLISNDKKIQNVVSSVNSLTKDELRREFANY